MELLELEDGKVALGSLGMSEGFLLITDGAAAQSEPGDWKMLAIWATFDEEGATELRILSSNCYCSSVCLKESKSNQAETNKLCRTTVASLLAENL